MQTRSGKRSGSNGDGLGDSPAKAAAARAMTAIAGKRRLALELETPAATATDKTPKAAHIRRRVQLVAGKTVKQALKLQVPDKNGDLTKYKKKDFKYDVKAGFLRF